MAIKVLKWTFFLIVPVGGFILVVSLFQATRWYTPTTAEYRIKLIVGNDTYMVPANYIWSEHRPVVTNANFHMLYPGAEPLTKENRRIFNAPNWGDGRLVTFHLVSRIDWDDQARYHELEKVATKSGQISIFGEWREIPYLPNINLLIKEDSQGKKIFLTCYVRTEFIKYPSCSRYFPFNSSTYVYYHFSKDRLEEWESIQNEIYQLMNKFKIAK